MRSPKQRAWNAHQKLMAMRRHALENDDRDATDTMDVILALDPETSRELALRYGVENDPVEILIGVNEYGD